MIILDKIVNYVVRVVNPKTAEGAMVTGMVVTSVILTVVLSLLINLITMVTGVPGFYSWIIVLFIYIGYITKRYGIW